LPAVSALVLSNRIRWVTAAVAGTGAANRPATISAIAAAPGIRRFMTLLQKRPRTAAPHRKESPGGGVEPPATYRRAHPTKVGFPGAVGSSPGMWRPRHTFVLGRSPEFSLGECLENAPRPWPRCSASPRRIVARDATGLVRCHGCPDADSMQDVAEHLDAAHN